MSRALRAIAICALVFGCEIRERKPESEAPAKDTAIATPSIPATTLTPVQLTELRAAVIAGSTLFDRPELTRRNEPRPGSRPYRDCIVGVMRRTLSTIVTCALLFGCEIRKRKPESEAEPTTKDTAMTTPSIPATTLTPEQLAELRAAVIANSTLFDRPELTPTDPAVVDRHVIEALYEGKYPATPTDREYYLRQGRTRLTNWLSYEEEGLAYLTKRIEERYARPVITRDGDLVRIDAGVVPGTLGVHKARLRIMRSPLIERGELVAAEVARLMTLGMTQHPDAKTYQVEVDIPSTWSKSLWTYRYDRAEDAIRMYAADWPEKYYVTGKLRGKLDSVASLYHMNMTEQPLDQRPIRSTELR